MSFEWPGPWYPGRYDVIEKVLRSQCGREWWFGNPRVEGQPFGRLVVMFDVAGNDTWTCLRRAYDLAETVFQVGGRHAPRPAWEGINRGGKGPLAWVEA